jgi:hypothetical protein
MHKFKDLKDSDWDIFVMDWGGVLPGCEGLTTSIYERLVELTYEFPNKLFVLWSSFTRRLYLDAVGTVESRRMVLDEMQGLIAPNVVFWFEKDKKKRCRTFFELPVETTTEKSYYKYGKPIKLKTPGMII